MSTTTEKQEGSRALRICSFLMIGVTFYVLSIGPMCLLTQRRVIHQNVYTLIYLPLGCLCDCCHPVGRLVKWYTCVWTADSPDR